MMKLNFRTKLLRSKTYWQLGLLLLTASALIFYNEYLVYVLHKWPHMECKSTDCIRVLLVSDPHILGEDTSQEWPYDQLFRWDSDRYLAKTFMQARSHLAPDVVMFVGDIMDSGSKSNDAQFARYLERFNYAFPMDGIAKVLFVPGDNDIGGENFLDKVETHSWDRFQHAFQWEVTRNANNCDFFMVNQYTFDIANQLRGKMGKIRIMVSHLPFLFSSDQKLVPTQILFMNFAMDTIRPQMIFTGHFHKSTRITANVETGELKTVKQMLPKEKIIWEFELDEVVVNEIMVPPCSYRVGEDNVGYGAAVIDVSRETLAYAVLWSPSRLSHLMLYKWSLAAASLAVCAAVVLRVVAKIPLRWVRGRSNRHALPVV